MSASGQTPNRALPRTADGKPNLNGIWQVLNSAAWDLQDHTGALGVPPGQGVVVGGQIPYRPAAAQKKQDNFTHRATDDPAETTCSMPGVPRATYLPFPFEIIQTPKLIAIAYEFAHARRNVFTDGTPHPDGFPDFWMGDSRGRWEGDTLVIDVTNLDERTWLDHAGNFHSDALHVVERYTMINPDHIMYEATLEDPKVFTGPWKIGMPLYRKIEKNVRLLEYECVYYLQDLRYGNAKPVGVQP
ncbi:MAG: hypothetical protein EXQ47_02495 [Bryobacterales bacterium]|nr:hypothetical protein [Bryobacterales bacterium]